MLVVATLLTTKRISKKSQTASSTKVWFNKARLSTKLRGSHLQKGTVFILLDKTNMVPQQTGLKSLENELTAHGTIRMGRWVALVSNQHHLSEDLKGIIRVRETMRLEEGRVALETVSGSAWCPQRLQEAQIFKVHKGMSRGTLFPRSRHLIEV